MSVEISRGYIMKYYYNYIKTIEIILTLSFFNKKQRLYISNYDFLKLGINCENL